VNCFARVQLYSVSLYFKALKDRPEHSICAKHNQGNITAIVHATLGEPWTIWSHGGHPNLLALMLIASCYSVYGPS